MRVPLTVADFLRRAVTVYGERVAIHDEPGAQGGVGDITYGRLGAMAEGLAASLDAMGVGPGERVALVSPNAAKFLAAFFGVSGSGRVLAPVNFRLTADEVAYIVDDCQASVLLVDPELEESLAKVSAPTKIVLDGSADAELFGGATHPSAAEWDADEEAICTVNYTSGTTSRPKGVRLTHRNCWINATTFGWHLGISDRDVLLHTLPMFHANGWGVPYAATGMGAGHVVLRKVDGEEILKRIALHGVTVACAAPAVTAAILEAAERRRAAGTEIPGQGTMRIVGAGAPPPSKMIQRIEEELGWEFIQLYGLTETSPLLTFNRAPLEWDDLSPQERSHRLCKAGPPALGVTIRVDENGEVCARSNHVFESYWDNPAATAEALDNGWFHTGDGGYLEGADLVITDRKKDVIISGGENVSSIEVEDCIYQHPQVAEVAVIGVPDQRWGETVKALVVAKPGAQLTESDVIDHCRSSLAHFKCPTSVELRDSLPRTATGKLQKFKLRAPYWQGYARQIN